MYVVERGSQGDAIAKGEEDKEGREDYKTPVQGPQGDEKTRPEKLSLRSRKRGTAERGGGGSRSICSLSEKIPNGGNRHKGKSSAVPRKQLFNAPGRQGGKGPGQGLTRAGATADRKAVPGRIEGNVAEEGKIWADQS